jgi:hypothetical protein
VLVARPVLDSKAGEGGILEHGNDGPALLLGKRPAQGLLILDRRRSRRRVRIRIDARAARELTP